MHEYSMMMDIVDAALKSIENYEVEKVEKVFQEHVLGGTIVTEYALAVGSERTH